MDGSHQACACSVNLYFLIDVSTVTAALKRTGACSVRLDVAIALSTVSLKPLPRRMGVGGPLEATRRVPAKTRSPAAAMIFFDLPMAPVNCQAESGKKGY